MGAAVCGTVAGDGISPAIRQGSSSSPWLSDDRRPPPETMITALIGSRRNSGNNPLYRSLIYRVGS